MTGLAVPTPAASPAVALTDRRASRTPSPWRKCSDGASVKISFATESDCEDENDPTSVKRERMFDLILNYDPGKWTRTAAAAANPSSTSDHHTASSSHCSGSEDGEESVSWSNSSGSSSRRLSMSRRKRDKRAASDPFGGLTHGTILTAEQREELFRALKFKVANEGDEEEEGIVEKIESSEASTKGNEGDAEGKEGGSSGGDEKKDLAAKPPTAPSSENPLMRKVSVTP